MDFFDFVSDNFFSILSSKNKRIYMKSIIQVFKVYETASILGIDKKIVVDDLTYYLETNSYFYEVENENDDESNPKSKKDLALYILRRMEECGWIYVDVSNDYEEILNFTDGAITICEALINAYPILEYDGEDVPADLFNPNEYQGYIYNIYSLLNQENNIEYAITFDLVYSNTRMLIRAIRRLDARMKDYIQSVVDNTDVKGLMEKLVTFKNEIFDKFYAKLKISDNVDRYRLSIVTKLESYLQDEVILTAISNNYLPMCNNNQADAINRTIRNIDEVIDAFNAIEDYITEIDNKNRNYINSTIGKIKFLLSEDENIIGKINTVLRFVKDENKRGRIDKALKQVSNLYTLNQNRVLDSERSLYVPRGRYNRNYNQILEDVDFSGFTLDEDFMKLFKTTYNEQEIERFLFANLYENKFQASDYVTLDTEEAEFVMVLYSIIYAVEKDFEVKILNDFIESKTYRMKDFIIEVKK